MKKGVIFLPKITTFLKNMTYRKKNRWLFGCSFGFCDNPKYLYLDVHHNRKDIESWWISKTVDEARRLRAKGINAVYVNSLHGYFLCLSAKVYIYSHHSCDINYFTSGNVIKVNLVAWGSCERNRMGN